MGDQGVRGSLQYDNRRYVYSDDRWISLRLKRSVKSLVSLHALCSQACRGMDMGRYLGGEDYSRMFDNA